MCDHSNESYLAVLLGGTVYYAVQGEILTFTLDGLIVYKLLSIIKYEKNCDFSSLGLTYSLE